MQRMVNAELVDMPEDEQARIIAERESTEKAAASKGLQESARVALAQSDVVVLRCYESSVLVPIEWVEYRNTLRSIIRADPGGPLLVLPPSPQMPGAL
ncbi:hypothetical protein [Burkholderia stagnalis]|uniref:hypothetical protein n=1 Tax=Burkholderia stagnalis TaxID=1503054 RepID=UPI000F7FED48|nr:hypothetical protein [Burkholderia stagnalis]